MTKEPIKKSKLRPWLDAIEEAKFVKGTPGETSDRWSEKPNLTPCWRGARREWHVGDGSSYQSQLWCPFWKLFINPSGYTCELCRARTWPEVERFRAHVLPGMKDKQKQADLILKMLDLGEIDEAEAVQLGETYGL